MYGLCEIRWISHNGCDDEPFTTIRRSEAATIFSDLGILRMCYTIASEPTGLQVAEVAQLSSRVTLDFNHVAPRQHAAG